MWSAWALQRHMTGFPLWNVTSTVTSKARYGPSSYKVNRLTDPFVRGPWMSQEEVRVRNKRTTVAPLKLMTKPIRNLASLINELPQTVWNDTSVWTAWKVNMTSGVIQGELWLYTVHLTSSNSKGLGSWSTWISIIKELGQNAESVFQFTISSELHQKQFGTVALSANTCYIFVHFVTYLQKFLVSITISLVYSESPHILSPHHPLTKTCSRYYPNFLRLFWCSSQLLPNFGTNLDICRTREN